MWGTVLALAGTSVACESAGPAEPESWIGAATERAVESKVETAPVDERAADPTTHHSGPPTDLVPPPPGQEQLVGVVGELLPAGGYTYLELELEPGSSRWVVTMRRGLRPGDRIRVESIGSRPDFHSRRLDRRFTDLVFGVVEVIG